MSPALPTDPTDEELARDWLLSEQDLAEVGRCRGQDKRHSFAIQLCTLRAYGRFLGQDYGAVPVRILNHVGRQLGLPPVLFAAPPARKETDAEHERRIRAHLGFSVFDEPVRRELAAGKAGAHALFHARDKHAGIGGLSNRGIVHVAASLEIAGQIVLRVAPAVATLNVDVAAPKSLAQGHQYAQLIGNAFDSIALVHNGIAPSLGHNAIQRDAFLGIVLFFGATIPLSAVLADRYGNRPMLLAATLAIIAFGLVLAPLFGSGSQLGVLCFLALGLALMGFTYGPLGTALAGIFPTSVRYTGASLAFNLAGILGASLAPYIATWLAGHYGLSSVGCYLSAAGALTALALFLIDSPRDVVTA